MLNKITDLVKYTELEYLEPEVQSFIGALVSKAKKEVSDKGVEYQYEYQMDAKFEVNLIVTTGTLKLVILKNNQLDIDVLFDFFEDDKEWEMTNDDFILSGATYAPADIWRLMDYLGEEITPNILSQ